MGIRAGGDPLNEVVPSIEELVADPRRYLTQGPLLIRARSYLGLTLLFLLPGVGILVMWGLAPQEYDRLALGLGLVLAACLWAAYSLGSAGHSLFLGPDGVEIRYRGTTVHCPWDLFDTDGEVWSVAGGESPVAGVTMPIAPEAVPLVIWRRGVVELGRGLRVQAPQAWMLSARELVLPGRYELRSEEVGKLLLLLGSRLGGRLAAGELRAVAGEEVVGPPPEPDRDGYYLVSLTRFRLPPCCVVCAGEPDQTVVVTARNGFIWANLFSTPWLPGQKPVAVDVPVCQRCHDLEVTNRQNNLLRWAGFLAVGGAVAALLAPPEAFVLALLMGASCGALLGMFLGTITGIQQPLELRGFHAPTGTVRARFRNRDVEKRYREWRTRT